MALSFAGAQWDYVEQVAQALQARGVRCFYDAEGQIELAVRDWTRLERRAALARAVRERREYVLPARFDDTPLPGLLSDMVTVDLRTRTPQQFAAMIADGHRRPLRIPHAPCIPPELDASAADITN